MIPPVLTRRMNQAGFDVLGTKGNEEFATHVYSHRSRAHLGVVLDDELLRLIRVSGNYLYTVGWGTGLWIFNRGRAGSECWNAQ